MNWIVLAQVTTMLALAVGFYKTGEPRLAGAQVCYLIATGFLFFK